MSDEDGIPRWLELQAEIDFQLYALERRRDEIAAQLGHRSPLDAAIDRATGREAALIAEVRERVARIAALQAGVLRAHRTRCPACVCTRRVGP